MEFLAVGFAFASLGLAVSLIEELAGFLAGESTLSLVSMVEAGRFMFLPLVADPLALGTGVFSGAAPSSDNSSTDFKTIAD